MQRGDKIKAVKQVANCVEGRVYKITDINFEQGRGYMYYIGDNCGQLVAQLPEEDVNKYFTYPNVDEYNIGSSDYSDHTIQPWDIWEEYHLNPWDADIIKRILRTKVQVGLSNTDSRIEDYNKIIHICQKRIKQLQDGYEF